MGASAVVAGTAISCESRGRGSWRSFTEREALVVEGTCAQLIPTDRDPGAREAGVVHYIDIQLAGDPRHGGCCGDRLLTAESKRMIQPTLAVAEAGPPPKMMGTALKARIALRRPN